MKLHRAMNVDLFVIQVLVINLEAILVVIVSLLLDEVLEVEQGFLSIMEVKILNQDM